MNVLYKRPLFCGILLFLLSSVIVSMTYNFPLQKQWGIFVLICLFFLDLLYVFFRRKSVRYQRIRAYIPFLLFFFVLGAVLQAIYFQERLKPDPLAVGEYKTITATVKQISYQNENVTYFIAETESIDDESYTALMEFDLFLPITVSVGDTIVCTGSVVPVVTNKQGFDLRYAFADGICATVEEITKCTVIASDESQGIFRLLSLYRSKIQARMEKNLDPAVSALFSALLIGERSGLDPMMELDFQRIGITHMISISGMHFSILLYAVMFLLSRLGLRKNIRLGITMVLAIFYLFLSGLSMPAIRACFMFVFSAISMQFREEADSYTSLALAIFVIYLIFPGSVYDIGLWLSFFGTLGIIAANDARFFERKSKKKSPYYWKWYDTIGYSTYISVFAFFFTLPLSGILFQSISVLSLLTNLIFAPLMELALYLSFFTPFLADLSFFTSFCSFFGNCIFQLASLFSNIPFAYISTGFLFSRITLCLFCLCLFLLWCIPLRKRIAKRWIAGSCLVTILILCLCNFVHILSPNMYYVPLGGAAQGEFLLCQDRTGDVLYDVSNGSSQSARVEASQAERFFSTEIKHYVLTHYHNAQRSSVPKITTEIKVRNVWVPEPRNDAEYQIYIDIASYLEEESIPLHVYSYEKEVSIGKTSLILSQDPNYEATHNFAFYLNFYDHRLHYVTPHASMRSWATDKALASYDLLLFSTHPRESEASISFYVSEDVKYVFSAWKLPLAYNTQSSIPKTAKHTIGETVSFPISES